MKKVAILSSIGPPWGGVGVHIKRLLHRLKARDISYVMYDQLGKNIPSLNIVASNRSLSGFIKFVFNVEEEIIHLHTSNPYALLFLAMILKHRKKKIVATLHNQNIINSFNAMANIAEMVICRLLLNIDHIICVNNNIYSFIMSIQGNSERISLIPAFLPPTESEVLESNLSNEILSFVESHQPIIGSHGWFGNFINGMHVYSFDMITKLIEKTIILYPNVGFYTVITDTYDNEHRNMILHERKTKGLENNWIIIEEPNLSAVALYKKSDLFLRPTVTDGDSVSVRECLYLGVPVIASDCVPRPDGCIIFNSRDQNNFEAVFFDTMAELTKAKKKLFIHVIDNADAILAIYEKLIQGNRANQS